MNFTDRAAQALQEGILLGIKYFFVASIWLAPGYLLAQKLNVTVAQAYNGNQVYQWLSMNEGANYKALESVIKERRERP